MTCGEYMNRLEQCRSEFEARRLFYYWFPAMEGTLAELLRVIGATDAVCERLMEDGAEN